MLAPGLIIRRTRSPLSMFSPSSGSLNSVAIRSLSSLADRRVQFLGIDAEFANCFLEHIWPNLLLTGQRCQGRQHDVFCVDFKKVAKGGAILTAAEAVCTERQQFSRHPLRDALWQHFHVVRSGDKRSRRALKRLRDV